MAIFDLDRWREILDALGSNKLRTALTAFGVFWGIFMLMLMLGSGNGLRNGVMTDFGDEATNSFFVWSQRTSKPYRGLPAGRSYELNNGDTEALRRQLADASIVAPRNQLGGYQGGNNVTRGNKSGGFEVMGDIPEYRRIQKIRIAAGRFINDLDMEDRRKIAVIGTRVRDVLFEEGEDPIGASIRINGVYFKVVGLFESNRSGEQAGRDTETVFIPFTTFQRAFNYGDGLGWFAITSRDGVPASRVEEQAIAILKKRHRVHPEDDRAVGSWNTEERYNEVQGLFTGIQVLVWIVGVGTLAAGVIGVSNIMLVIVKERTNEIGIRRAVGARPLAIMSQIVLEAVLLTTVAGYCGLFLGFGLMDLIAFLMHTNGADSGTFANPTVNAASALQALAILVVAGGLAGLIPARRAVRINTVEALRGM
jgi:putative ABC transport system permease protein